MKSEIVVTTFTDPEDKYCSFIEEKRYNSKQEFQDNFIVFLTTLFPFLKANSSLDGFDLIYDKIEEVIKDIKGFRNLLREINKYIDAYNSYWKRLGVDVKMARVTERCWEMLSRTDSQLINTRKELVDLKEGFAKTEADLKKEFAKTEADLKKEFAKTEANLKEGFEKEIARLEKIIKDLLG